MELFFSNWYPGPILLSSFLISPSYYILAFILTTFHSSKFHNVTRAYGSYLLNIETGPCFFSSSFVIEENWFLSFFLFISFFFPNDSFKEFFKMNGLPLFLTVILFPRDTHNTSYYIRSTFVQQIIPKFKKFSFPILHRSHPYSIIHHSVLNSPYYRH